VSTDIVALIDRATGPWRKYKIKGFGGLASITSYLVIIMHDYQQDPITPCHAYRGDVNAI
jgi:2-methylaconitate cis-trans-isomerase PrpF